MRAATRALREQGWEVAEPQGERRMGSPTPNFWYTVATRDGYLISVVMHQVKGILSFSARTPGFRVHGWEVDNCVPGSP